MTATVKAAARERPILFSGPMVKAILEGRKTQTRRVVDMKSIKPSIWTHDSIGKISPRSDGLFYASLKQYPGVISRPFACRYGQPGRSRLWVRETFRNTKDDGGFEDIIHYRADCEYSCGSAWRPSIFMPRWASRLTLEIVNVRVERLQEISADDCASEGTQYPVRQSSVEGKVSPLLRVTGQYPPTDYLPREYGHDDLMRAHFASEWDALNGKKHPWASNPFVWVLEFRRTS